MRYQYYLLGFLLFPFLLTSCSTDKTGPLIILTEPGHQDIITVGTTLHFEADFEDASELFQYKIELNGKHVNTINEYFQSYDTVLHIGSLSGNTQFEHLHFIIPDTVLPGPYQLEVSALDEHGNQTVLPISLTFENDLDNRKPLITINSPTSLQSVSSTISVDVSITEKLSDNITDGQLHYIHLFLQSTSDASQVFSLGTFTELSNFDGHYNSGVFNHVMTIPGSVSAGNYYLFVEARDRYFNQSESFVEIQIP